MNELAKNSGAKCDTLKTLWLARPPTRVRVILATNRAEMKLENLAEMANKVMDNLCNGKLLAVDDGSARSSSLSPTVAEVNVELLTQMKTMALELKTLRSEGNAINNCDHNNGGRRCVTVLVPGSVHRNRRHAVKTGCAGTTSDTARRHDGASLPAIGRRLTTTTSRI
ncbi:unnamed protein product [Parnassius apollo]|uniref:(apollo) hypothetical protein n=1 Tax=Parnassius apollo TaxID=110799 RepID=A0A8S3WNZ7_PARAO|nr:unnamed protein product [Parnassius apollo]